MTISPTVLKLLKGALAEHNIDQSLLYSMCYEDVLKEGSAIYGKYREYFSDCAMERKAIILEQIMAHPGLVSLLSRASAFEQREVSPEHGIDGTVLEKMTYDQIKDPIDELPIGLRVIFNNYFFKDETVRQTAELLGISENVTKKLLEKAKAAFRKPFLTSGKFTKSTDEEIRVILKEKTYRFVSAMELMFKFDRKEIEKSRSIDSKH